MSDLSDPTVGYHLIEREDQLTDLTALSSDPRSFAVALAILEFLRSGVCERLGTDALEVIRFEYHGAYPALGLRASETQITVDQVRVEVDRIMADVPLSVFVAFLRRRSVDWGAEVAALLGSGPKEG